MIFVCPVHREVNGFDQGCGSGVAVGMVADISVSVGEYALEDSKFHEQG